MYIVYVNLCLLLRNWNIMLYLLYNGYIMVIYVIYVIYVR